MIYVQLILGRKGNKIIVERTGGLGHDGNTGTQ